MRNLQEQVKKAFCYQKLFNASALNFKNFSESLKKNFLTVGQNNFGNKIPFLSVRKRIMKCDSVKGTYNLVDTHLLKAVNRQIGKISELIMSKKHSLKYFSPSLNIWNEF